MTTFTSLFENKAQQAISTNDPAVICKELVSIFEQAKTFHQFHQAWLTFGGFKYFQYNQSHSNDNFNIFIENPELNDEHSECFGINLYMTFGHDYKTLTANARRIDYSKILNDSALDLDFSKFNFA